MKQEYRNVGTSEDRGDSFDRREDLRLEDCEDDTMRQWAQRKTLWSRILDESKITTLERQADDMWHTTSFLTKLAICIPILASALIGPLYLISLNWRSQSVLQDLSIPEALHKLPWSPTMLPDFDVLKKVKASGDLSSRLYPDKLGSKVLLLDIDSRPWEAEDPANLSHMSYGRLNHYFYAQMHGYDYQFMKVPPSPPGTFRTWPKVGGIYDALQQDYQFVIFVDYDIVFPHLKIPIEWMLDHWNVTKDIVLTVGLAPDNTTKNDMRWDRFHNQLSINSGFMIVQNGPVAHDMFRDWRDCPTDIKFPGCSKWKSEPLYEQRAYSDYIRYAYPNTAREIPCDEVLGYELQYASHQCRGTLVRHMFRKGKRHVKAAVEESIAKLILPTVVQELQDKYVGNT